MNRSELLKIALDHAKSESINTYPGQVVCLYFNNQYEYTVIAESKAAMFLEIEPNSTLVMRLRDGEPLEASESV